jgi:sigma-B regulation protein RsbU (phosphoserine phosphatase)
MGYNKSSIEVPEGSTMYLFSDGVFEITDKTGKQWSIADFEQVVCEPAPNGCREAERLFHAVRTAAQPGPLEDDFSLVVAHFD